MNTSSGVTVLTMRGIRKEFPGVLALDDVEFDLREGEVHILLGENGAGKSTLMKILCGAYSMDSGVIEVAGEPVQIQSPSHAHELGISIIYQEFNLIPHLSVAENIFLGNEPELYPGIIDRRRMMKESGERLVGLGVHIDPGIPLHVLSVAQQQMVEVAKALSIDARIMIMDEPTSSLTENEIDELFAAIRRLKKRGVGIIYISHRMEEVFAIGDRATVLRDGCYISTHNLSEVDTRTLVTDMVDRPLDNYFPKEREAVGEVVLAVDDLSNRRLRNISFKVRAGEVLGIAGLLGAGRTELARALFGADPVTSGRIQLRGREYRPKSSQKAIKAGIGFVPEDRKRQGVVLGLNVKENISLPNAPALSIMGVMKERAERSLAQRFVDALRIKTPSIWQKVIYLSGGNQQKVVLAKWLGREPEILIFDEPTRGIDVGAKVEIYQLMNRLTAKGIAIIMISSELPEILGMSDRILVMHDGRISAEFDTDTATQEELLNAALGQLQP